MSRREWLVKGMSHIMAQNCSIIVKGKTELTNGSRFVRQADQ
jgi:hypothetical protein